MAMNETLNDPFLIFWIAMMLWWCWPK